jgi:hypothetical protein
MSSRAEQPTAGKRKKRTIPIVLPSGGAAAARRRHRAMQHRGYIGRESPGLLLRLDDHDSAAASGPAYPSHNIRQRDAARRAWGNPSCYSGLPTGPGQTQAHGWRGRGLKWKVTVTVGEEGDASGRRRPAGGPGRVVNSERPGSDGPNGSAAAVIGLSKLFS